MELQQLAPIALITAFVEFLKLVGLPKGYERVAAFLAAVAIGGFFYWNREWLEIGLSVLTFALGSTGLYEFGVKPFKNIIKKDPLIAP